MWDYLSVTYRSAPGRDFGSHAIVRAIHPGIAWDLLLSRSLARFCDPTAFASAMPGGVIALRFEVPRFGVLSVLAPGRGFGAHKYWEAGGNCNLGIAAARLGLRVIALGHVGDEVYGHFLLDVLQIEGIDMVGLTEDSKAAKDAAMYETLLCWVLVDPFQRHGFCSVADFSDEPAFSWLNKLSGRVEKAIQQSKILFCNGYAFDELSLNILVSALFCAIDAQSAVFFDPGPRGRTLFNGTREQRKALGQFLKLSDVLLLTLDEAESLTGIKNPILAGRELIDKGVRIKWVVIKMGAKGSMLITKSTISCAPAFMVNVVDTVGCGDSFTAAIAYGFLHDLPHINTLVLANAVGGATATRCGAGRNVATIAKVLELMRQSNINEDYTFWSELFNVGPEVGEVFLLSKTNINGHDDHPIHVPIVTVISQLMPKFESMDKNGIGFNEREEQVMEIEST
ncbi:probable fructokinase-1 [Phalaenopsis equestris]|uniref:probable fructokinase-1 n=1 Tax=Phalaenopsis equestris TaxID=78828 RepID=UPI0009E25E86|nr:probable fructokinase-1 [Phalaenopsis equestris]